MPRKALGPPPDALTQGAPLRDEILALAGVDKAVQATLVKDSIRAKADALKATVVQRLVVGAGRGVSEVREFVDTDHPTRLRAADGLIDDLVPKLPSVRGAASGPSLTVVVNLKSRRARPVQVIDVTPKDS